LYLCVSAVCAKSLECVELLVASGSIVNQQSYDNSTALHHAVSCNQPEIVALLLSNGASIELACDEDMTPVFCACHLGRLECLHLLVDNCRECRKFINMLDYKFVGCH
jgi:ankyrin repeat protein